MTLALLLAFNAALIAALLSPGPAMLVCIRQSVTHGAVAGAMTGLGLAVMASLWTLAALFGLHAVFAAFPFLFGAMKLGGALYLIWIAWRTWAEARQPLASTPVPGGAAFMRGFLVNLANPKSVLFAAAVLVVIFPPDLPMGAKLLIGLNHLALETCAYAALAWAASRGAVRSRIDRAKPVFDRITAVVLGGLGLRLLVER